MTTVVYPTSTSITYAQTDLISTAQLPCEVTYDAVGIREVDSKLAHSSNNGQQALNCIVMYDWSICEALFLGISILVDYPKTQTAVSLNLLKCQATNLKKHTDLMS